MENYSHIKDKPCGKNIFNRAETWYNKDDECVSVQGGLQQWNS
ncbi:hypothetical protein GS8_2890 [Geobacillus stearothermophilus]|uniref:Uncharacterized protein n=1 Tax=Geobacillus stearothermophilus TaxID=1422 RepID=A0ABQ7HEU5_GEOSE|nr:hypothetical protein GS8_2890 [Geobacillus stearothermophilus]